MTLGGRGLVAGFLLCSACATGARAIGDGLGAGGAVSDASGIGGAGGAGTGGASTGGASGTSGTGAVGGSAGGTEDGRAGSAGVPAEGGVTPDAGLDAGTDSGSAGGAPGDASTDGCLGVICTSPPPNQCSGANLEVFTSPGTCRDGGCFYASATVACPQGCASGACTGNPCIGITCTSPPPSTCADATNLRVFDAPGTCSGGACQYTSRLDVCPFGCAGSSCNACQNDGDCPSGRWCSGSACVPCNVDARCGASCANCTAQGDVCNAAATGCVDCRVSGDCSAGSQCVSGTCVRCASDAACGAACAPCGSPTPRCLDQGSSATCVGCLGDGDCGAGITCNTSTHTCDVPSCPLPAISCTTAAESRMGCASARTIGRLAASSMSGYTASPTTCSASNASDVAGCTDGGSDHTYRIYLRSGEAIAVTATTAASCLGSTWFGTLKVIGTQGCASTGCGTLATCSASKTSHSVNHTATQDGWHFIVMDGSSGSDSGTYSLNVRLTCSVAGCEC